MAHMIHYQDDLYIAESLAAALEAAAKLNPDPEILGEAVSGMARDLDVLLRRLAELIASNTHLVERLEYIRLLSKCTRRSAEALTGLLRPDHSLADFLASSADELRRIAERHEALSSELSELLRAAIADGTADEDLVSGDELSQLLKA